MTQQPPPTGLRATFGPAVRPPNLQSWGPFATQLSQPLSQHFSAHVNGRRGPRLGSFPRSSRAARAARLIPQQPSYHSQTQAPSEESRTKPQTITILKAPRTPPAQRDRSPEPSPTSRDLGLLTKATGHLTI
ncbi:hypothetical protein F4774DRAFT_16746 [Daldinia eschscholtzii]|nr:hypothetical protein F4774DRAFT_16746 [Daldinia eschscholtzii]